MDTRYIYMRYCHYSSSNIKKMPFRGSHVACGFVVASSKQKEHHLEVEAVVDRGTLDPVTTPVFARCKDF